MKFLAHVGPSDITGQRTKEDKVHTTKTDSPKDYVLPFPPLCKYRVGRSASCAMLQSGVIQRAIGFYFDRGQPTEQCKYCYLMCVFRMGGCLLEYEAIISGAEICAHKCSGCCLALIPTLPGLYQVCVWNKQLSSYNLNSVLHSLK